MRFKKLTLRSKDPQRQKDFYQNRLSLPVLADSGDKVCFQIGHTVLEFERHPDAVPVHFAINIPCNQVSEALNWLSGKIPVLPHESRLIQPFPNWNAEALYFYDADQNIVEWIGRKNLKNEKAAPFHPATSFLEISEIGLATTDIPAIFAQLNESLGIEKYDGNFHRFCAAGTETGLFILANYLVKKWFPTDDIILL
ncbi:MAG: VOC family protein, partial [Bacteroidetes bacterium]